MPTEPKPDTQNRRLLDWLRNGRSINPLQSWQMLGIYRLGARIFDLKEMGWPIVSERMTVTNRYGEDISVGLYKLGEVK